MTNEQSAFIRAFRHGLAGPPPQRWPSPTVLRRWLKRREFRRALAEIRQAVEFQAGVHLTAASIPAAATLTSPPDAQAAQRALDPLRLIERRSSR